MKSASMLSSAFLQSAGQALPEPLLTLRANRASALTNLPLPTRKNRKLEVLGQAFEIDR